MTSTEITTTDPDQLLTTFNEQLAALDQIVQASDAHYDDAKQILMGLLELPGQDVAAMELAWKKANKG